MVCCPQAITGYTNRSMGYNDIETNADHEGTAEEHQEEKKVAVLVIRWQTMQMLSVLVQNNLPDAKCKTWINSLHER